MKKIIHTSGKRKSAIARVTLREGTGIIKVNKISLDFVEPKLSRMKIREPLLLARTVMNTVDVDVNIHGGGVICRAEAARLAIARALSEHTPSLKNAFADYDRQLLVADVRRKESSKPNSHGQARAKRQKSYR
ncbi:MAG: 30S ribosomal protein S9 [Nanoarchaeota archaeon]|nr:30S ribosomal protein S9 [Nanoarchaeota archaeon]MBU1030094.1 30S ribosomal protein S9 [Nanoarchaeota archaeon]MBU1849944.1 30S ribosomal protein S9 [Nanoarchaeota archaeon]